MNRYLVLAVASIIVWVALVFVLAVPSGWVHVALGAGCILLARGLMGVTR
jgi:hypothetical protein